MPETPSQSGPTSPPPSEELLLDYVEGLLSTANAAEARAALRAHPAVATRVEGMMRDREVMAGLPDLAAPSGLVGSALESAHADLEREALAGLAVGDDVLSHPPVVVTAQEGVLASFLRAPFIRPVAMAASVLLVVGLLGLWVSAVFDGFRPRPMPTGDFIEAEPTLADSTLSETRELQFADARAGRVPAAEAGMAFDVAAEHEPLTAVEAIELAREGRLAIRAQTRRFDDVQKQIGALAADHRQHIENQADVSRARWAIVDQLPTRTVAMIRDLPRFEPDYGLDPETGQPRMASSGPPLRMVQVEKPEGPTSSCTLDIRLEEDALLTALERMKLADSKYGQVEFIALDEPWAGFGDGADSGLSAWWTRPPAEWVPRARVPVVIEIGPSRE